MQTERGKSNPSSSVPFAASLMSTSDDAWKRLYTLSDDMLRGYKKVMEFYSKWMCDVFPYTPSIGVYKDVRNWTAVNTLDNMESRKPMFLRLGAAEELFDVISECKGAFDNEPEDATKKKMFVQSIKKLIKLMVVENPKQRFPANGIPSRLNVKGSFTKRVRETLKSIEELKTLSEEYLSSEECFESPPRRTRTYDKTVLDSAFSHRRRSCSYCLLSFDNGFALGLERFVKKKEEEEVSTLTKESVDREGNPDSNNKVSLETIADGKDPVDPLLESDAEEAHLQTTDKNASSNDVPVTNRNDATFVCSTPPRSPSPIYSEEEYPPTPVKLPHREKRNPRPVCEAGNNSREWKRTSANIF